MSLPQWPSPDLGFAPELAPGLPLVALIGPQPAPAVLCEAFSAAGLIPIVLTGLADANAQVQLQATVTALGCDSVVLLLPANVGLDGGSAAVWGTVSAARVPRAVLVTGLGAQTPDLEEFAAITTRALGEHCVIARLPVLDDEEEPAASMDLFRLAITGPDGELSPEADHLRAVADARETAIEAVLVTAHDDDLVSQALSGLTPPAERLVASLTESARAGELVPVLPMTPDAAALADLSQWFTDLIFVPDRLLAIGLDCEMAALPEGLAVVLSVAGGEVTARLLHGRGLTTGPALLTRPGAGAQGGHPDRSWPTWIEPLAADLPPGSGRQLSPGETFRATLPLRAEPGETLCSGDVPVWLIP